MDELTLRTELSKDRVLVLLFFAKLELDLATGFLQTRHVVRIYVDRETKTMDCYHDCLKMELISKTWVVGGNGHIG